IGRCLCRPALTHALWLLVLVKLVTPPLVLVPVPWPEIAAPEGTPHDGVAALPDDRLKAELQPDRPKPEGEPEPPPPGDAGAVPPPEPGPLPEEVLPQVPAENEPPAAALVVPAAPGAPASRAEQAADWPDFAWLLLLGGLWLSGTLLWLSLAAWRIRQFNRLLGHGRRAADDLQRQAEELAIRLGICCPPVWLVPGTVSPMVWAWGWSRRLLVPERLLAGLSGEQRAAVLAHELAHLRRRDHWVRGLELVVLALYWWCPLVWW